MGISTIQSYQGSQIFEAIGIGEDVINKYFTGTVSRIGGITISDIEKNVDRLHTSAFDPLGLGTDTELESRGSHKFRSGKEEHLYNPQSIICSSRLQGLATMKHTRSIQSLSLRKWTL